VIFASSTYMNRSAAIFPSDTLIFYTHVRLGSDSLDQGKFILTLSHLKALL
jgi:hypothetical protein